MCRVGDPANRHAVWRRPEVLVPARRGDTGPVAAAIGEARACPWSPGFLRRDRSRPVAARFAAPTRVRDHRSRLPVPAGQMDRLAGSLAPPFLSQPLAFVCWIANLQLPWRESLHYWRLR